MTKILSGYSRQAGRKTPEKTEKRDKGRTYPAWGRHPAVLGGKCTSGVDR